MKTKNSCWERSALSYCSNLHPGESLAQVCENIRRWFCAVKQARQLDDMSSGLWLSAKAAEELQSAESLKYFQNTLATSGLRLTSLNGFPYGNFHADIVKADVYSPHWSEIERVRYTEKLVDILSHCLPENEDFGSISTLPIGYKQDMTPAQIEGAINNMIHMEHYLASSHQKTGRKVLLCLEMEPDCVLEKTSELLAFFLELEAQLGHKPHYIAACFDVCHQGVMYEDIQQSLQCITAAGIKIGKIQVSNAIEVDLSKAAYREQAKQILQPFSQDKFLHQIKAPASKKMTPQHTTGQSPQGLISCPDLIDALNDFDDGCNDALLQQSESARIHFHIPLHADGFISPIIRPLHQELRATFEFLAGLFLEESSMARKQTVRPHLEIETYTWQVLPKALQPQSDEDLIAGIEKEFAWLENVLLENALLANETDAIVTTEKEAI